MVEGNDKKKWVIDVREADEFYAERVPGSVNLPLSRFSADARAVLLSCPLRRPIFICKSGKRAALAVDEAVRMGLVEREQVEIYHGGLNSWKAEGLPVETFVKNRIPVLRQAQMTAGLAILASSIGVILGAQGFAWVSAFFGFGLFFAGASGFCGLATVLSKMPWNSCGSNQAPAPKETR